MYGVFRKDKKTFLFLLSMMVTFLFSGCTIGSKQETTASQKEILHEETTNVNQKNPSLTQEQRWQQIALDYLAGKPVLAAASLGLLSSDNIIKATPKSFRVETTTIVYDPVRDEYLLEVMRESNEVRERLESRIIKTVVLEYNEPPYHAEIQIDILNNKVAGWEIGQL